MTFFKGNAEYSHFAVPFNADGTEFHIVGKVRKSAKGPFQRLLENVDGSETKILAVIDTIERRLGDSFVGPKFLLTDNAELGHVRELGIDEALAAKPQLGKKLKLMASRIFREEIPHAVMVQRVDAYRTGG